MIDIKRKFGNNKIMVVTLEDLQPQPNEIFKRIEPEIVPGIFDYYLISNYGRVYNSYMNIFLKPGISGSGYYFVYLSTVYGQKMMQLHRLVMLTFEPIENADQLQVNHKDGNKLNNKYYNLEWVTRSQNILHAYANGLNHLGEDNIRATITEETAIRICELLQVGNYTNQQIADICGTTESVVSCIKQHRTWKYISINYIFYQRPGKLFTEDMINNICKYFENNHIGNLSIKDHCINALMYYGYDCSDKAVDSIRKVYTKKYYTNISTNYNF